MNDTRSRCHTRRRVDQCASSRLDGVCISRHTINNRRDTLERNGNRFDIDCINDALLARDAGDRPADSRDGECPVRCRESLEDGCADKPAGAEYQDGLFHGNYVIVWRGAKNVLVARRAQLSQNSSVSPTINKR